MCSEKQAFRPLSAVKAIATPQLTPACQQCLTAIDRDMMYEEVHEATGLSVSVTRRSLQQLVRAGLIAAIPMLEDMRKIKYRRL